jgi:hypothetical protein
VDATTAGSVDEKRPTVQEFDVGRDVRECGANDARRKRRADSDGCLHQAGCKSTPRRKPGCQGDTLASEHDDTPGSDRFDEIGREVDGSGLGQRPDRIDLGFPRRDPGLDAGTLKLLGDQLDDCGAY